MERGQTQGSKVIRSRDKRLIVVRHTVCYPALLMFYQLNVNMGISHGKRSNGILQRLDPISEQ